MNINVKHVLLCFCLALLFGCNNPNDIVKQMEMELSKGYAGKFEDGALDGHRVYGYDASKLHDSIVRFIAKQESKLAKLSETDIKSYFPLVYFVALKFENRLDSSGKIMEDECFRIQLGTIDFYHFPDGPKHPHHERPSCAKCYTFFMVAEDDHVEILSVAPSRNLNSTSSVQGKHLSYGSINSKIQIWDAYMPDRNHPEKILNGKYRKVFAVMTDRPFNYMAYTRIKQLELLELMHSGSVYRLCWQTPECMIFIPEALLPEKESERCNGRFDASEGPHGH